MANYEYNETTGIVIADTSAVKSEVEQEYKEALGQDLDTSESTPQGRLIEAETVARKRTIENMALLANMFNPQQAYGIFLDSLAYLFGVQRVGATATRVLCQLTGTAGTVIPSGSQAKDTNAKIYVNESDITLDNTGNGSGYFYAQEKGAIECPANTLTSIVTAVSGWSTINNATSGNIGNDQESDYSLRSRIKLDQYVGQSLLSAIHSRIMKVDGVEDCLVIDNPASTADTTTISGITIPAHSVFICVDGGENANIAKAIFDTISAGCGYTTGTGHTQTVTITDEYSLQQYAVSFDRPVYQAIDVSVELGTAQASADIVAAVKKAITDYASGKIYGVDGLTIGRNVSPFEIASAITHEVPEVYIANVEIAEHGDTPSAEEITIQANERATIAAEDITVS